MMCIILFDSPSPRILKKKAFAGNKERPGGLGGATNLNSGQNEIGNVYVHYRAFKLVRQFKGKNL